MFAHEAAALKRTVRLLSWSQRFVNDEVVVSLAGELDLSTVAQLRRRLLRIAESSTRAVVVDMADVRFIDAGTVGVILGARSILQARGLGLRLEGLHGVPAKLVQLLQLEPPLVRRDRDEILGG
jgi:anti-anti-sigma factor